MAATYQLHNLQMPSTLRHMEFDGRLHSHAFQISFTYLHSLTNLRILRLTKFTELKSLPPKLGDLTGLHELSLSNCNFIEQLSDSVSNLKSLQILKMDCCYSLTELTINFGSLSSLYELSMKDCIALKELPDSVENLTSLELMNLSGCKNLLKLPPG